MTDGARNVINQITKFHFTTIIIQNYNLKLTISNVDFINIKEIFIYYLLNIDNNLA